MFSGTNYCYCCCSVIKSCLTLCNPMDCSPPGSPGHGMLQARILEWVVISFPRGSSWPRNQTLDSLVPCIAGGFLSTEPLGKPNILLYVYYSLLFHPLMCIILLSASFWIFSPPSPIGIKLFEVRDCLSCFTVFPVPSNMVSTQLGLDKYLFTA